MASVLKVKMVFADGREETVTVGPNNNASINKGLDTIETEIKIDKHSPAPEPERPIRFEMWSEEENILN